MIRSDNILSLLKLTIVLVTLLLVVVTYLIVPKLYDQFKVGSWNPSDWFLCIQTLIFTISAFIAYRTISSSRAVSRERATLDTILADNKDTHLIEAKTSVYAFVENANKYLEKVKLNLNSEHQDVKLRQTLSQICEVDEVDLNQIEHELKQKMMVVLNRHEFYAIGINSKLLDENLFKRMHCSNFLKLWDKTQSAVTQLRTKTGKDTLFKDFEQLANRWKANPLRSEDIK